MTSGGRWPALARFSTEVGVVADAWPVLSQAAAEAMVINGLYLETGW